MSKFYMEISGINNQINSLNNTRSQIHNLQSRLKSEIHTLNRVEFDNIDGVINEINRQYDNCELVLKKIDYLSIGLSDIVTIVTGAESKAISNTLNNTITNTNNFSENNTNDEFKNLMLSAFKETLTSPWALNVLPLGIPAALIKHGWDSRNSEERMEFLKNTEIAARKKVISDIPKVLKELNVDWLKKIGENPFVGVAASATATFITDRSKGKSDLNTAIDSALSGASTLIGNAIPSDAKETIGKWALNLSPNISNKLGNVISAEDLGGKIIGSIISGVTSWVTDIYNDVANEHLSGWELAGEIATEGAIDMALAIGTKAACTAVVGALGVTALPEVLICLGVSIAVDAGLKWVLGDNYKEDAADFVGKKLAEDPSKFIDTMSIFAQTAVQCFAPTSTPLIFGKEIFDLVSKDYL